MVPRTAPRPTYHYLTSLRPNVRATIVRTLRKDGVERRLILASPRSLRKALRLQCQVPELSESDKLWRFVHCVPSLGVRSRYLQVRDHHANGLFREAPAKLQVACFGYKPPLGFQGQVKDGSNFMNPFAGILFGR